MRVLVTGGAGFIGSNFIRHFLKKHPDASVLNLDKLTYAGNLDNLTEVSSLPSYEFVRGDVADGPLVRSLMRHRLDAVVHFAAESHVDRSIVDAQEFIRTNVLGTHTLVEEARRSKISRFLHVSTDEVYGSLEPGEVAQEEASLRPNSPYAATKAASDLLVRSFWKTYGFPAIITRSSNNYGPNQFPEKLIPLMIINALEGKKIPIYGDGMNQRDWIFVEDHCIALDRVLGSGEPGRVYNIGFGESVPNLEVARRILRILGKSKELLEFVTDRPGHDRRYAMDIGRISRELGWKPAVDLEEGLSRTVSWYQTHPEWVRKARSGEYRSYYEKLYEQRDQTLAQLKTPCES